MEVELRLTRREVDGVGVDAELLAKLGANDAFVTLTRADVRRVVRLRGVRCQAGVVFLSPTTAMRFDRGLVLEEFLKERREPTKGILGIGRSLETVKAKRVYLQRIGLPDRRESIVPAVVTEEDLMIPAIRQFFKESKKFVAVGDVLTMMLPTKERLMDDYEGRRYFKVVHVEPKDANGACFVDPNQATAMIKGGVCTGFLPARLHGDGTDEDDAKDVMKKSPSVPLPSSWRTLAEIVAPVLMPGRHGSHRLGVLLHGSAGKVITVVEAARALGMKYVLVDCLNFHLTSVKDFCRQLSSFEKEAQRFSPCFLVLRHMQYLSSWLQDAMKGNPTHLSALLSTTLNRLTQQSNQDPEGSVILVGTSDTARSVAPALRHVFTHELRIRPLDDQQKMQLLRFYFHNFQLKSALRNVKRSLHLISERLVSPSTRDVFSVCYRLCHAAHTKDKLGLKDVETVLSEFLRRPRSHENVAEVPKVKWKDIGGLEDVKKLIKETVELPIKHRSLFATGLSKRIGVLLYGPPGVGKTLLAKAMATECKTKFISIKGPELLDMYFGETERLVRDLFKRAKKASPCILFFDELDAFVPARGAENSGAVMDRIVSQFLAELDALSAGRHDVFVFGATNRIDLINPALVRPGRLDKLVEVGLPRTAEAKCSILRSLTRKFNLAADVNLSEVASHVRQDASGADLYAICAEVWTRACKRCVSGIGKSDDQGTEITVMQQDFLNSVEKRMKDTGSRSVECE